jgi:hypothetical protein
MKYFFIGLLGLIFLDVAAQKTIVVLGSSTAEGFGASPHFPYPPDSSWVKMMAAAYNKNPNDGLDTTVINLAKGGYTTYHILPTNSYTPNRPPPDTDRNITKALTYNPDVIIINMPSNDISNGFQKPEIMANWRQLFTIGMNNSISTYITTTQPRDFAPNLVMMQYQKDLRDSVMNVFGNYGINFWDDLVSTNPPNDIRPEVAYGDGIHINNLGHRLVFERVMSKFIFSAAVVLPVKLQSFEAARKENKILLKWLTTEEEHQTQFEIERSSDGQKFTRIGMMNGISVNGSSYSYTDDHPLQGTSFYRLKITNGNQFQYSNTRKIASGSTGFTIANISNLPSSIQVDLSSAIELMLLVELISVSGQVVQKMNHRLTPGNSQLKLNTSNISPGMYLLRFSSNGRNGEVGFSRSSGLLRIQ